MDKWYKVETSSELNPCVCGCERRAYFKNKETVYIKCVKCLLTASGKSEKEAEEAWQEMTKGVEIRYAEGRETKAGGQAKTSRRGAKKGVQRKSVSRGDSTGA